MKNKSRIAVLLISLLMGAVYFLPLWKINLLAPQYPEGLAMKIWISNISGDLQTINNLNHYIGMKYIEPDSIPELTYMPYVLAFLIGFGLLVAIINKVGFLAAWFGSMTLAGIVGFIDFYKWTYDYGHNLDPRAAIKVPGMTYQPPIIGTKKLMNFTAASYPDWGGIIMIVAGVSIFLLLFFELKKRKGGVRMRKFKTPVFNALLSLLVLASCSLNAQPIAIEYGKDNCENCRMTIMDKKYGSEIITEKGKVFKFDSIECMAEYYAANPDKQKDYKLLMITDYTNAPAFTDATQASYLKSENLPSPMGADLTGFADKDEVEKAQKEKSGKILTWEQVIDLKKKKVDPPDPEN